MSTFDPQPEPSWIDAPVHQDRHGRLVFEEEWAFGPTCPGPGPTRLEFVNEAGHRDVRTVEQCPRCDGHGGSHGAYTLITLEQQTEVA